MNQRTQHICLLISILVIMVLAVQSCTQESQPPNIVLIISEDISTDLGCYGRGDLKTPTLDSLASKGILFTQAYTTSPVCSPSRSAIMTGMYQNSIGAHHHRSTTGPLKSGILPFTHYLAEAGYFTCNMVNENYGTGKTDFNFEADHLFDGEDWNERKKGQPFFAQVSIYTTHRDDHWYGIEDRVDNPVNPEKVSLPSYYPDHPVARLDWARYLNSIQFMDKQVASLLHRLDSEGLTKNTVVIFMGDHGRCHIRGKQWLYDSGIHIPLIISWPDHLKPGTKNQDLVSAIDITATILDLADTQVPGFMQGQSFISETYEPRTEIYAARDWCDGVEDKIRAVRTEQYKYIRNDMSWKPYTQFGHYKEFYYPMLHLVRHLNKKGELTDVQQLILAPEKQVEELYDVICDPEETRNLAGLPEYQTTLSGLRKKVLEWEDVIQDSLNVPESRDFMEAFLAKREEKYAPKWEARGINAHDPTEKHLQWWEANLEVNKFLDNQPLNKPGAERKIYKVVGRDTLYAYVRYPEDFSEGDRLPAIVFFHGGGWRRGRSTQFDRQSTYLASRGMITIQADYRVMLRDSITPFECVMDGKSAVRWVRQHADQLGINPEKIAAGGGSAGGHIAAACGHIEGIEHPDEDFTISSKPNALLLFNPVFDNGPQGYRYDLFGERYTEISPVHNVSKGDPPSLVQLGDQDVNLPVSSARFYEDQMMLSGNICKVVVYPGHKHGFFSPSKGGEEVYKATIQEMDQFLTLLGYLEPVQQNDLKEENIEK